jgi:hypothetical protein
MSFILICALVESIETESSKHVSTLTEVESVVVFSVEDVLVPQDERIKAKPIAKIKVFI